MAFTNIDLDTKGFLHRIAESLERLVAIEEEKLKLYKGYRNLTDKENDDITDIASDTRQIRRHLQGLTD